MTKCNLLGQRFGKLLVVKELEERKWRMVVWECLCDCGNTAKIITNSLKRGNTKSCGCWHRERAVKLGESNVLPSGQLEINHLFLQYQKIAKKRDHDFNLTKEQCSKFFSKNCTYCGKPPSSIYTTWYKIKTKKPKYYYNGIDRVDNTKGYSLENCVPCCKTCNTAKMQMTLSEFKAWIKAAYMNLFGDPDNLI